MALRDRVRAQGLVPGHHCHADVVDQHAFAVLGFAGKQRASGGKDWLDDMHERRILCGEERAPRDAYRVDTWLRLRVLPIGPVLGILGWSLSALLPAGLVEITQRVPVIPLTPIVVTACSNSATAVLDNKRCFVGVVGVPGARVEYPLMPGLLPRTLRRHGHSVRGDPVRQVKRRAGGAAWRRCLGGCREQCGKVYELLLGHTGTCLGHRQERGEAV